MSKLVEFFDRCRAAVRALYEPEIQARLKREQEQLQKERLVEQARLSKERDMLKAAMQNQVSRKTMLEEYLNYLNHTPARTLSPNDMSRPRSPYDLEPIEEYRRMIESLSKK